MSGLRHEQLPGRTDPPDSTSRNQLANAVANLTHNGGLAVYNSNISGSLTLGHGESSQDNLRRSYLARYSAVNPTHIHNRIVSKKDKLLDGSTNWVFEDAAFKSWDSESEDTNILWIHGNAGKGKTMILVSAIAEIQRYIKDSNHDDLLLYFFCAHEDTRLNDARSILQGLIFSILSNKAFCSSEMFDCLLENDPLDAASVHPSQRRGSECCHDHEDPEAQYEDDLAKYWIILIGLLDLLSARRVYILIDALDECDRGLIMLLDRVIRYNSRARVRWLMTSRNVPEIAERLERDSDSGLHMSLELNAANVRRSVAEFVKVKVAGLSRRKRYDEETAAFVTKELQKRSQDTFLWVALACQQLSRTPIYAVKQTLREFPEGLSALYIRMLDKALNPEDSFATVRRSMFQTALTAFRPMSVLELAAFIDIPGSDMTSPRQIEQLVDECGSFLVLEGSIESPQDCLVVFVHLSAAEFMDSRVKESQIQSSHVVHRTMAHRALQILGNHLVRNSLDWTDAELRSPDKLNAITRCVWQTPIHYATQYWADHANTVAGLHGFPFTWALSEVYESLLAPFQWEVLCHANQTADMITSHSPENSQILRMPPFSFDSLLGIYTGYLVNGSSFLWNNQLMSQANPISLDWMIVDEVLTPCDHARDDLARIPDGFFCSPDGSLLALNSQDWPIFIVYIRQGRSPIQLILPNSPKEYSPQSLSEFSPCSNHLAICGSHCTINLWSFSRNHDDVIIPRHTIWEGSTFAFSEDGTLIACGRHSGNNTIKVFNMQTRQLHAALAESTSEQANVSQLLKFSPDATVIVEIIHSLKTEHSGVLLWSVETGDVIYKLSPIRPQRKPLDAAFCAKTPIVATVDIFGQVRLISYSHNIHELASPNHEYQEAFKRTAIVFLPASTILVRSMINATNGVNYNHLTLFDVQTPDIAPYDYLPMEHLFCLARKSMSPFSLLHDLACADSWHHSEAAPPTFLDPFKEMLASTPYLYNGKIYLRSRSCLVSLSRETILLEVARNMFILGQKTWIRGNLAARRVYIDVDAIKATSERDSRGLLPRRDIGEAGRSMLSTAWDKFAQELAQAGPRAESKAKLRQQSGLLSGKFSFEDWDWKHMEHRKRMEILEDWKRMAVVEDEDLMRARSESLD